MARLLRLVYVVLAFVAINSVSAGVVTYTVAFVSCVQGSTCPQGNPSFFSQAFALNGTLSRTLKLKTGDRLKFHLVTNVPSHPLTICKNSPLPQFCEGATGSDRLNTPITKANSTTSVTFTTAGTYYYGCNNHPGMGGTIRVMKKTTGWSTC